MTMFYLENGLLVDDSDPAWDLGEIPESENSTIGPTTPRGERNGLTPVPPTGEVPSSPSRNTLVRETVQGKTITPHKNLRKESDTVWLPVSVGGILSRR